MKLFCAKCKKEFYKPYRTKYCSMDCYLEVSRKNPNQGCFKKGDRPWNKRKKGIMKANKTSFKKGNRPATAKPLLTISIRNEKSGTQRRYIKIKEPNVWINYAKYIWLKSGKKIKKGYYVCHKDRNSLNDCLDNLICLSKKEYVSFHNKWNTKNTILNEPKNIAYRNKRRLKLNAIHFIRGQNKIRKVAKFKRYSKCLKVYCGLCGENIETNVAPIPFSTIRQRIDIFMKFHKKLIHENQPK